MFRHNKEMPKQVRHNRKSYFLEMPRKSYFLENCFYTAKRKKRFAKKRPLSPAVRRCYAELVSAFPL
jgi:hypothetical protein